MIAKGFRISTRGCLGLVILFFVRDPMALAAASLLLWSGARRFIPGLWSAVTASLLPALLWGSHAGVLCLLSGVAGVLIVGHVTWPAQGALSGLREDAAVFRKDFLALSGWRDRYRFLLDLVPPLPPRKIRPGLELSGWVIVLICLGYGFAWREASGLVAGGPALFVVDMPARRVLLDRPGRTTLDGPAGGITVEHDGMTIRVVESRCLGHRCESQSVLHGGIVCAPNRILIRPIADSELSEHSRGGTGSVHSWTG